MQNRFRQQLKRLHRLEGSLLTLSQIDAGTLPLQREKVDLYTVLHLAAENLNDLLQEKSISVTIPEKGCVEFWGDVEWTMEALINLIKNCMEHSNPGGAVHCDYAGNPLYAEIRVWDDGAALPQRICRICLSVFTGDGAQPPAGLGLAWPLPVPFLNCRTGP